MKMLRCSCGVGEEFAQRLFGVKERQGRLIAQARKPRWTHHPYLVFSTPHVQQSSWGANVACARYRLAAVAPLQKSSASPSSATLNRNFFFPLIINLSRVCFAIKIFQGGYPAKLKKVLIVTAPLWFKAPFKILRLFVREKLRERVFTVSIPQLPQHIPRESLPQRLGGGLEVHHEAWLLHCLKSMTNRLGPEGCEQQLLSSEPSPPQPEDAAAPPKPKPRTNGTAAPEEQQQQQQHHEAPSPLQPPSSSASSGFSDDDSLHAEQLAAATSSGMTIEQLVESMHARGRAGLVAEYAEIKQRPPDGTFNNAKLVCCPIYSRQFILYNFY